MSDQEKVNAVPGDIVYFKINEPHRISEVTVEAKMILLKKIGATKA